MSKHEHQCSCHSHHDETHSCQCQHEGHCCGGHHHDHEISHHHGLTINFDGEIETDINRVWEILTKQDYVSQWFNGLTFVDFRPGGALSYQRNDETTEFMILDIEAPTLLTFTWFDGTIALQLSADNDNFTVINLSYWIERLNDDTAEKLTQWLIALQAVATLAENKEVNSYDEQFAEIFPRMQEMLTAEEYPDTEFE